MLTLRTTEILLLSQSFLWQQFQKLASAHTPDFVITVPDKIKLPKELVLIKKIKREGERERGRKGREGEKRKERRKEGKRERRRKEVKKERRKE